MASDPAAWRSLLIRADEVSPACVMLYVVTVGIAFVCAWVRALVLFVIGTLILWIAGWPQLPALVYLVVALAPLVISLMTVVVPAGGAWFQSASGGRAPSERERFAYDSALRELHEIDPGLRPPRRWFVVDRLDANAAAYADALMIHRGLIDSGALAPVLAHELGHLNSADARLAAALARLTTPPRTRRRGVIGTIAFVASGSFALWLTGPAWANYWRAREYSADAYAARLGQAEPLAAALESHVLAHDLPIPYPWIATDSHPPTELRIDRLLAKQLRGGLGKGQKRWK